MKIWTGGTSSALTAPNSRQEAGGINSNYLSQFAAKFPVWRPLMGE